MIIIKYSRCVRTFKLCMRSSYSINERLLKDGGIVAVTIENWKILYIYCKTYCTEKKSNVLAQTQ